MKFPLIRIRTRRTPRRNYLQLGKSQASADGGSQQQNPWGGAGRTPEQESAAGQSRGANRAVRVHYSSVGTAPQAGAGSGGKTKKAKAKKPRKPMSTGRRWAATVAWPWFRRDRRGTMYGGTGRRSTWTEGNRGNGATTQPLLQTDSGSDSSAEAASASPAVRSGSSGQRHAFPGDHLHHVCGGDASFFGGRSSMR